MRVGYYRDRLNRLEARANELATPDVDYSALLLGSFPDLRRWLQNESDTRPCVHRWFEFRQRGRDIAFAEPNGTVRHGLYECLSRAITDYVIRKTEGVSYEPDMDPCWQYLNDMGWKLPGLEHVLSPDCTALNCPMAGDSPAELFRRELWDTYCDRFFNHVGKHDPAILARLRAEDAEQHRRLRAIESENGKGSLSAHHTAEAYE